MSKSKKQAKATLAEKKEVKKPVTMAQKEPEKTPIVEAPAEPVVEPTVEPVVEEIKEPESIPEVKKTKKEKKEEKKEEPPVVIAEVVTETEENTGEIAPVASKLYDPDDRIDANHQIDLMKMVHTEYVTNPNANATIQVAMKKQFDAMALNALMRYNAQVEADFQTLGIKVNNTLAVQMEKMARELYGITLKGLPAPNDPNQKILEFKDIPQEVKKEIKKDIEAEAKPIPEPDPKMPEKEKISAIETIFAQKNGIGQNLIKGIDWARKAYSFADTDPYGFVLANLLNKSIGGTLPRCLRAMVIGKMGAEHSIFGVHALMKTWLPNVSDQNVADITRALTSYAIEHKVTEFNSNAKNGNKPYEGDPKKELAIYNETIIRGCQPAVITGVVKHTESVVIDTTNINTKDIRKTVECAYGDSDSIIQDKLNEIAQYYNKPISCFSDYISKAAYNI